MLSPEAILEFQTLYRQEFGIELSAKESSEVAMSLLRFYKTVFKPTKKGEKNGSAKN